MWNSRLYKVVNLHNLRAFHCLVQAWSKESVFSTTLPSKRNGGEIVCSVCILRRVPFYTVCTYFSLFIAACLAFSDSIDNVRVKHAVGGIEQTFQSFAWLHTFRKDPIVRLNNAPKILLPHICSRSHSAHFTIRPKMEKRRVFRLSLKQRKMADAVIELAESQTYTEIQKVITSVRNFRLSPSSEASF